MLCAICLLSNDSFVERSYALLKNTVVRERESCKSMSMAFKEHKCSDTYILFFNQYSYIVSICGVKTGSMVCDDPNTTYSISLAEQ